MLKHTKVLSALAEDQRQRFKLCRNFQEQFYRNMLKTNFTLADDFDAQIAAWENQKKEQFMSLIFEKNHFAFNT